MESPNNQRSQATPPPPILTTALRAFAKSFLIAYGVRAGVAVLLKLLRIFRDRKNALSQIASAFGEDAVRFGLFMGGFAGIYKFAHGLLNHWRGPAHTSNAFIAGGVAGVALLAEEPGNRLTISHYLLARALQCSFAALHSRGWWRFISDFKHWDTLIFMLSCGQVMYAYVLRPDTIPQSYYNFILQTGPIPEVVLQNVRRNIRGQPVDIVALNKLIESRGGPRNYLSNVFPALLDNVVLHPQQPNWIRHALQVFYDSFGKIIPLYLSLTFVPMVALRFRKVLSDPVENALHGVLSAGWSTTFLAAFVALYMFSISAHRKLIEFKFADLDRDHKLIYYLAGVIAGSAVLIERKSRRSELVLYALPRAADSLFEILYEHKWLAKVPHGEVGLFSIAMATIMFFYEHEPDTISPLVNSVLSRFIEP